MEVPGNTNLKVLQKRTQQGRQTTRGAKGGMQSKTKIRDWSDEKGVTRQENNGSPEHI